MFELKTERLRILPLNIEQIKLLKDNPVQLEAELGLNPCAGEKYDDDMEREIDDVFGSVIKNMESNPPNYTWFTMWQIILIEENKIIGLCGFNGMPDPSGEVEFGYALKPNYHQHGYMPEALAEFIRFAFMHPKVKTIMAQTPVDLIPTQKLLLKLGFEKAEQKGEILIWKLGRK